MNQLFGLQHRNRVSAVHSASIQMLHIFICFIYLFFSYDIIEKVQNKYNITKTANTIIRIKQPL